MGDRDRAPADGSGGGTAAALWRVLAGPIAALVVITATGKRPVLIDAAELVMKPLDLTQLFAAIERYCH